jgi:cytochrome c oxidase assembly protein subunit 15
MKYKKYLVANFLSILSIFLLFFLGGLVRATGSGMGCPDWPKCFGEYIPPTAADNLPENYQEIFKEERVKKLLRFTMLLEKLGFSETAKKVKENEMVEESHEFNATKAYVEYVNRLFGALTGLFVFAALLFSLSFFKTHTAVFFFNLLGFLGVFLNALLGAVVVNSNLIPGIVTAHFLAAFGAIAFFIVARVRLIQSEKSRNVITNKQTLFLLSFMVLLIVIVQIILGTQVRSSYDLYYWHNISESLISYLGLSFQWHRVLGIIIILFGILQWTYFSKINYMNFKQLSFLVWAISLLQVIFGVMTLGEIAVSFSKLFHITFGALIFIIQFYICTFLILTTKNQKVG